MRCHCCLKESENDFCRTCSHELFGKSNFGATLKFTLPSIAQGRDRRAQRISISGAQPKFSLRIENRELVPTDRGGAYILKPATSMQFMLFAEDDDCSCRNSDALTGIVQRLYPAEVCHLAALYVKTQHMLVVGVFTL